MATLPTSELSLVQEAAAAALLLDPLRQRILEELFEPDSASGLARRLGLPRQKVNYHLRELEKHELLELVEERRKGNCTERLLRATARAYLISPAALGRLAAEPERFQDRFSSTYLVAAASRVIGDVARLQQGAAGAQKRLATLTLESEVRFASAESRHAFAQELSQEVARLVAKYHDQNAPKGRRFRLLVGAYPTITESGKE